MFWIYFADQLNPCPPFSHLSTHGWPISKVGVDFQIVDFGNLQNSDTPPRVWPLESCSLTLCDVPSNTSFESCRSFKSGVRHQRSPGTPLDLQMTALLPSTPCHYTGMWADTCARCLHTNHSSGSPHGPLSAADSRHAQNIRQRRKRTKREEEEEEGVDGGNNTEHAPLCFTGIEGEQEGMWQSEQLTLTLFPLGFPFSFKIS